MDTYITLTVLLIGSLIFAVWLLKNYFKHEKNFFTTLNLPLDNRGKEWYNNNRNKKKRRI